MALAMDMTSQMRNMMQREHPLNMHRSLLLGLNTTPIEDPLVSRLSNDPVVAELQGDPDKVSAGYRKTCCLFTCVCPLFIPHQLLCCTPCGLCMVQNQVSKSAKANHLILHENSLVYRMDDCVMPSVPPTTPTFCIQACQGFKVHKVEFVMLLDEKIDLEILPKQMEPCGKGYYPVETLVIKYENSLVASIDGPSDAEGFIQKFKAQKEKAIANRLSSKLDQVEVLKHRAAMQLLCGMTGGTMMGAMMGGRNPMAAMQAQQQFQQDFTAYEQRLKQLESTGSRSAPVPVAEMIRDGGGNAASLNAMTVAEILGVLTELGLQDHAAAFEKGGVDGSMLGVMDDETLKELGMTSGLDRKKLLGWVSRKKTG